MSLSMKVSRQIFNSVYSIRFLSLMESICNWLFKVFLYVQFIWSIDKIILQEVCHASIGWKVSKITKNLWSSIRWLIFGSKLSQLSLQGVGIGWARDTFLSSLFAHALILSLLKFCLSLDFIFGQRKTAH